MAPTPTSTEVPVATDNYWMRHESHVYERDTVFADLVAFAAQFLVLHGRLSYWLPVIKGEYSEDQVGGLLSQDLRNPSLIITPARTHKDTVSVYTSFVCLIVIARCVGVRGCVCLVVFVCTTLFHACLCTLLQAGSAAPVSVGCGQLRTAAQRTDGTSPHHHGEDTRMYTPVHDIACWHGYSAYCIVCWHGNSAYCIVYQCGCPLLYRRSRAPSGSVCTQSPVAGGSRMHAVPYVRSLRKRAVLRFTCGTVEFV